MENAVPKYQLLVNWIKEQIQQGKIQPGDKFYSEHKLGEMFGISRQTVRQAIAILDSEGYLEGRRGSGTFVTYKENNARRKTNTIGVISTYVDSYIFPPIIQGLGKVLSKKGYTIQMMFTLNRVENEHRLLKGLLQNPVDGLIVEPTKSGLPNPNLDFYRQIAHQDIPILFFNAYYPSLQGKTFPHVAMNDKSAGKIAAQRLIRAGHREIAAFFKSDDYQGHLRYAGYLEALIENGINMNALRVVWFSTEDMPHLFENRQRILEPLEGATAIVCYNDNIAAACLTFLAKEGFAVPDDFSLVSIDNAALVETTRPPLSSVNHHKEKLGVVVAENMLKMINDPDFDANLEFEPKLVERDSVKSIK